MNTMMLVEVIDIRLDPNGREFQDAVMPVIDSSRVDRLSRQDKIITSISISQSESD